MMNKSHVLGSFSACIISLFACSTNAALIGVLPATPLGTDWQAYYDDQLDISWTANANTNSLDTWDNQVAWASGLTLGGVTGWRLPSADVNGDDVIVSCTVDQAACKDNEYGHLFNYGAGTVFGSGITAFSPGPFSDVRSFFYWSGTEFAPNPSDAWSFVFSSGNQGSEFKNNDSFAWAVHSGNVSAVPVPAAVWLFGSGLMGLLGFVKRKR